MLMVVGAVTIGGFFVYRAAKSAGFDSTLLKNNPGLAIAKMAVAANPDLETVSTNDSAGTITVRDKTNGDVLTLRFDTEKKTLVATDKDGKEVRFNVSGDDKSGSLEINSDQGTVKIGAAASNNMPAWIPVYPGSAPQGTMSINSPEGNTSTYAFKTKDGAEKVLDFYEKEMGNAGLKKTMRMGADAGGMLTAEDAAKTRTIAVNVGSSGEGTDVSVTVVEKKQP